MPHLLLSRATLPTSHLYNLLQHEQEAVERYIPNSSPGFFFVDKKAKTPRPCIQDLNSIAMKNK